MNTQPEALRLASSIDEVMPMAATELRRLHDYKSSYEIWLEKTNWVQDSSQWHELGKHRADVLKDRIDRLHDVNQKLVEALEAFDVAAKESQTIIGFAGRSLKLLTQARAALAKARGTE